MGLLALVAIAIGLALHRHPGSCTTQLPPRLTPADTRVWVASAVANVPCPSTGRALTGLRDSAGVAMTGLDPISNPAGGYLAVYDAGAQIGLARSSNLTTWRRVQVLGTGQSPSLEPVPGTGGYLLAYAQPRGTGDAIRVTYFRSLSALLVAHQATTIELPLRLSGTVNGAPWFANLSWNGSLRRSQLTLGFDYRPSSGGPSREALGVLRGFRNWSATPDARTDRQIDRTGLTGNHGQGRQFVVGGRPWRLYEAADRAGSHIVMDDVRTGRTLALRLGTEDGTLTSSLARPVAQVLPAPGGTGSALVVSLYVDGSSATRSEAGELLYWTPLG